MNRCAQTLADHCIRGLATYLGQCGPIQIDRLTFNSSLKYLLINERKISIEISAPNRFEAYEGDHGLVVPNGPAISEARLSDFILGSARVRKQYEAVLRMKDERGVPAAWLLVSAYYCAYFACIELCKLVDRISVSFEPEELGSLKYKAVGKDHAAFFASGQMNFVGAEHAGKLVFNAVGAKPHAAAWSNALIAMRHVFAGKGWPDAGHYIAMLEDVDCSPSKIRNTWNYRRSDYFGKLGESEAREFRSLIGNHKGATAWLDRKKGKTKPLDPCGVAVLCEVLSSAVSDAGQRAGVLISQAG